MVPRPPRPRNGKAFTVTEQPSKPSLSDGKLEVLAALSLKAHFKRGSSQLEGNLPVRGDTTDGGRGFSYRLKQPRRRIHEERG